jgi:hypothetical protein
MKKIHAVLVYNLVEDLLIQDLIIFVHHSVAVKCKLNIPHSVLYYLSPRVKIIIV